jgi:hypothetical protein
MVLIGLMYPTTIPNIKTAAKVRKKIGVKIGVIYGPPRTARKKFFGDKKTIAPNYSALQ